MSGEIVILNRDVDAVLVPSAARIRLAKDTEVTVTQALGSSYTVNVYGNLARIDGQDADALGNEVVAAPAESAPSDGPLDERVWAQLKTCYDPEIPVNIVDLGLVYGCRVEPQEKDRYDVFLEMTLTAPGCGMGPVIVEDVRCKILTLPEIADVYVELVFDPPWDQNMMSEAAKLSLGMI